MKLPIWFFSDCRTVTHSAICPYGSCWSAKIYPPSAFAGKRGILDIIQNPVFLSNANAPINLFKKTDVYNLFNWTLEKKCQRSLYIQLRYNNYVHTI